MAEVIEPAELRYVRKLFERLYGEESGACMERLRMRRRRARDLRRKREPLDERETVLITYGDSIVEPDNDPLVTLREFAEKHLGEAFGTIHVLPFWPYSSDDGFSIIDYRTVRPDLGKWCDVEALGRSFGLMVDLVLNHCSRQSPWFREFTAGIAPARRYFHAVDPNADVSGVTRPRSSPLLSPAQTRDGEVHVWTTFSDDQVDLNFSNPDVFFEFLDLLLFYVSQGARIVRLDAIAYLWKRLGTPCIHLEETHVVVKLFRALLDLIAPGVVLLSETNVPHAENVSYFGDGDEAHMVYQFSLPPLLLQALTSGSVRYLWKWLRELPPAPVGCAYLNFTASHDGIGMRPLEGLVPERELERLLEAVRSRGGHVSMKANADGTESPYELNVTYFDALSDVDDWGSDQHLRRFLCSQTVAMALQGVPAVYIHSLTATPNDRDGVERTGRARSINRHRWDLAGLNAKLSDPETAAARVFSEYLRRLTLRRGQAAFHPEARQDVLEAGDGVLAVRRTASTGRAVTCLNNFTAERQRVDGLGLRAGVDLLAVAGEPQELAAELAPYECRWWVED